MRGLVVLLLAGACGGAPAGAPDAGAAEAAADVETDAGADAAVDATLDAPDVDSIVWSTGAEVGYGVAFKDTGNPVGDAMFVG